MSIQEVLRYEVSSSWWAGKIWFGWGQDIAAKYFAWKTKRKFGRYQATLWTDTKSKE